MNVCGFALESKCNSVGASQNIGCVAVAFCICAARYREQQAEAQYKQALLQVQTEVMQAYRNYQSFAEQVNHYQDGLLRQAREVMDGKIYSYNRGEVSLLEVLDAQRTYDEVQAQYIETLFNYSSALVELERSAGFWDIEI